MTGVILVPLDGSEAAAEVLPHVEDLAGSLKADILLLQVIPVLQVPLNACYYPSMQLVRADGEREWATRKAAAEQYLSTLTQAIRAKNIYASWKVVAGNPADMIVEIALLRGASLVAMCTHARSGIGRVVHGSVAGDVVRRLNTVPVLLIRTTREAEAKGKFPYVHGLSRGVAG